MGKLKVTILSLSLVTVMSGAAVAPALGAIANYFSNTDPLLIKLIITLKYFGNRRRTDYALVHRVDRLLF
jgi:hypothetical protein